MNAHLLANLLLTELKLRSRRLSSLVALVAMLALAWLIIAAPVDDSALLVVNDARVLNTSGALALSSAALLSPLLTLFGFFLLRGRAGDDMRSGLGGLIASTPASSGLILLGRSLAGMLYLSVLVLAYMASTLLFQLTHGVAPLELGVYLQAYAFILLPSLLFTATCATLMDSVSALMGKAGDVLYFFIWVALLTLMASMDKNPSQEPSLWLLLDFSGMVTGISYLSAQLGSANVSLGLSSFDATLPTVTMPQLVWPNALILTRAYSSLLALLPLLLAIRGFHRYSPERVKLNATAATKRSPMALLNAGLRPLGRLVQPLFHVAARLPGLPGQVLADTALSLACSPASVALLILSVAAAALLPLSALGGLLIAVTACWGILISDMSCRDFQADTETLGAAMPGGEARRYWRQLAASGLLGLLFMGLIAWRWALAGDMLRCLALIAGVLSISALASLLGRMSCSARCFLGIFLGWLYIALNARDLAALDAFGFNGAANAFSIGIYGGLAVLAGLSGWAWQAWRGR